MINAPRKGVPSSPRYEPQVDKGPRLDPPVFPAMGKLAKEKVSPKQYAGGVIRVGKK